MAKNKTATAIAMLLTLTLVIPFVMMQNNLSVEAQTTPQQPVPGPLPPGATVGASVDSASFLSVRPNPVGKSQLFLINMWVNPPPHAYRQFLDFKLTVTKPDGKTDVYTMDSYVADGTSWLELVADQVGDWKLKFEFPGIYFPEGRYLDGAVINASSGGAVYSPAVYVKPSQSPVTTLTVQEDMVESWPESPMPTDYWTRPVNPEHREWWSMIGNYPWFGPGGGAKWNELYPDTNIYANPGQHFTPWVKGPESAHIAWKQLGALGGVAGGDLKDNSVYWPTTGWQNAPTIILWGRGYHAVTKPGTTSPSGQTWWQCYDIRTGELFWERPLYPGESEPNLIEYDVTAVPPVPGVTTKPDTPHLLSISNGYLRKYDAFTGHMMNNISISPLTGSGGTYYMNGHVLGVQDLGASAGQARYRLINWTTLGTSNFAGRIVSNTSYLRSSLPPAANTDYKVGFGANAVGTSIGGINNGTNISGYNLYTGESLWNKTIDEPLFSGAACVADHGKIALITTRGYCYAFDLATGALAWKTEQLDYPFDATGWGSYSTISGYGNFYWIAQTGVYSIDWATGNINWKFEKAMPYQYEGPYTGSDGQTVYPNHAPGILADGTLFIPSSLHSPESPYFRGLKTWAIDAMTGEEKWSLGISVAGQHTRSSLQLRVADGYLTIGARDGYMYVVGKGKTATTISAPSTATQVGQKFTITGTVLDLSPAQPGTAAIAEEYMDEWMCHIHLQMPKPTDAKGVPVQLTAIDPNGNLIEIGEATSDTNGNFGFTWAPEVPGLYQIIANFVGSASYGSSTSSTYFTAVDAPPPPAEPEPAPESMTDTYVLAGIGAIIATIVIVGLVIILMLRKRP